MVRSEAHLSVKVPHDGDELQVSLKQRLAACLGCLPKPTMKGSGLATPTASSLASTPTSSYSESEAPLPPSFSLPSPFRHLRHLSASASLKSRYPYLKEDEQAGEMTDDMTGESGQGEFLGALSPERRAAVEAARATYVEAGGRVDEYTDAMMLRFCVGNRFDAKRTAAHVKKTVAWRRSSGADAFRASFLSGAKLLEQPGVGTMVEALSFSPCVGVTRGGDLLTYASVGRHVAPDTLCEKLSIDEYFRANLATLEFQCLALDRAATARADGTAPRVWYVVGVEGLKGSHLRPQLIKYFQRTAPVADLYYPELMSVSCILGAPAFLVRMWNMLRHLFARETQDKVIITKKGGEAPLGGSIAPEHLPACYGGQMVGMCPKHAKAIGLFDLDEISRAPILKAMEGWMVGADGATGPTHAKSEPPRRAAPASPEPPCPPGAQQCRAPPPITSTRSPTYASTPAWAPRPGAARDFCGSQDAGAHHRRCLAVVFPAPSVVRA